MLPRQYDEKFHILQVPSFLLPDLGYFRARCEDRETPSAITFIDIDDFKSLNTRHHETKVDRNVLPRFMQAIEAHVFHHGYAYRQGGDEYLILVPSLSRPLAIAFLDPAALQAGRPCLPGRRGKDHGVRRPLHCGHGLSSDGSACSTERIEPSSSPSGMARTALRPTAGFASSRKNWRL